VTRDQVVTFLRKHKVAVVATVAPDGQPQAAVVGIATSDELEIIFDTVEASRKFQNLLFEPRIAVVVGWDAFVTVQIDGDADFPMSEELERIRACYFVAYPDGRARLSWSGLTHVRVRPRWLRYSDFTHDPPVIVEMHLVNGELVVKG
jgi:pyridoxine/pyridoxamine 5'-phosphate oxidase